MNGPGLSDDFDITADGPVRIVTINRPDKLNAFSEAMHHELSRVWELLESDADARAVVLTGAGRTFSAGGDFDDFEQKRVDLVYRRRSMGQARRIVEQLLAFRLPVVAAVNGAAIGMGCTIVTLCDVVFMAETAFLADPHVSAALVAGDGAAVTWPQLIGMLRAKRYILTGDRIPADEARDIGLANFVVPAAELLPSAIAFAHRLAAQPPQAMQATKLLLNEHFVRHASSVLSHGLALEYHSHDTPEYEAAIERLRPEGK